MLAQHLGQLQPFSSCVPTGVGPTSAFASCVPTGVHGSTCIVWASEPNTILARSGVPRTEARAFTCWKQWFSYDPVYQNNNQVDVDVEVI